MSLISQVLESKGTTIWSISPDQSVLDAIKLMAQKGIGALLVMDGNRPIGMISERDYARRVVLEGKSSRETPVRAIMTGSVVCVRPSQTVEEGMALMTDKRVRHLPVMDDGVVIGIISIGDLVKATIRDQQFIIEQLQLYIAG